MRPGYWSQKISLRPNETAAVLIRGYRFCWPAVVARSALWVANVSRCPWLAGVEAGVDPLWLRTGLNGVRALLSRLVIFPTSAAVSGLSYRGSDRAVVTVSGRWTGCVWQSLRAPEAGGMGCVFPG